MKAATELEESPKTPTPRNREMNKLNTPVRRRVRKFEDIAAAKEHKFRSPKLKAIGKMKDIVSLEIIIDYIVFFIAPYAKASAECSSVKLLKTLKILRAVKK